MAPAVCSTHPWGAGSLVDVVDAATRSHWMSRIGGKNTRPELTVRRYLHAVGLRFRLHDRTLPGSPDLVLPRYRTAVFVHGCFWHRHAACRYATVPSSRTEFWADKFRQNVDRDRRNARSLAAAGWNVLTIWECEISREDALDELFWQIVSNESVPARFAGGRRTLRRNESMSRRIPPRVGRGHR